MLLEKIKKLAREAGKDILEIYNDSKLYTQVSFKEDNSPLTLADKASNKVIIETLSNLTPRYPIISEEESETPYHIRKHWDTFWLVDPLDGTKEFINRNGEFTVNIALIKGGKPVMGVIYVPATNQMYWGDSTGAFYQEESDEPVQIKIKNRKTGRIAARSKSHASDEEEKVLESYGVSKNISVGSSLKFCMVAQGKADVYYRHGPTMEWDTAAGQAIVEAAGGKVFKGNSKIPFTYNKENLRNGSFICLGF